MNSKVWLIDQTPFQEEKANCMLFANSLCVANNNIIIFFVARIKITIIKK